VLCDIDGVLQTGGAVGAAVGAALGAARSSGDHVLLSSGCPESRRGEIEAWLTEHMGVGYDALYLRRSGDSRRTTDVKVEMFDEHIRERYRVRYALAGHHRSSEAWRLLGLAVFQVA
jgi:ribonucleotide monophosphatase NagD (HAD superfamily)